MPNNFFKRVKSAINNGRIKNFFYWITNIPSRIVVTNALIYQKCNKIRNNNLGDDINFYMIKELTSRPVINYWDICRFGVFHINNYMCIGSILEYMVTNDTIVWGAGALYGGDRRSLGWCQRLLDEQLGLSRVFGVHLVESRVTAQRYVFVQHTVETSDVQAACRLLVRHWHIPPFPRLCHPAPDAYSTEQDNHCEKDERAFHESLSLLNHAAKIVKTCLTAKRNAKKLKLIVRFFSREGLLGIYNSLARSMKRMMGWTLPEVRSRMLL